MKIVNLFFSCIFMMMLLTACSLDNKSTKDVVLEIPNIDIYTTLLVQGVDKNGVSSEATLKVITDSNKIQAFIEKVNNMKVIKPPGKEIVKKSKELKKKGNYFFVLSDKETMDNKVYTLNYLKDGNIIFQEPNGKKQKPNGEGQKMIYVSKEKHAELLLEMKELLNITF